MDWIMVSVVVACASLVFAVVVLFLPWYREWLAERVVNRLHDERVTMRRRSVPVVKFLRCSDDLKRTKVRNFFAYHALYQRVEYR